MIGVAAATAAIADRKPYAVGVAAAGYTTKPLISTGDTIPETSDPTKAFKFVGISDGLGAHANDDGHATSIVPDETQLEAASDALGAFRFARPEDGAFNKLNRDEYLFVTTGGAAGANVLGRLYSLRLHPGNVTKGGTLSVVYNADAIVAAGGDIAISPDNIDVSERYLMINEDATTESRLVMGAKGREGSIWRFDLWLFDAQAHPPTTAPAPNTVEDGQLLLLRKS